MTDKKKLDGRLLTVLILIVVGLVFYFALSGYSFISYTCWAVALIIVYFWILKKIKPKYPKLEKVLNKIASYCIIFFCMVFAITEGALIYGAISPEETTETEYVIVLGAGVNGTEPSRALTYRLKAALEYLNEYPDAVCIVSGGQGEYEDITEAECMRLWLEDHGIQSARIIEEDQARNTKENIANSLAIIKDIEDNKPESITVITEGYHMLRASLMLQDHDVKPICVPAETELPILAGNYYIREAFALWKYLIIG